MKCRICGFDDLKVTYKGPLRDGRFGQNTAESYEVVVCGKCTSKYLHPFPKQITEFYKSEEYRAKYDGSTEIQNFHKLHDPIQGERTHRIGIQNFRDKVVLDFGAGGGSFLDAVHGFAAETNAVEPALFYKEHLTQKHGYYTSGKEFAAKGKRADVVVSFETIEHVEDPVGFLQEIYGALKSGGTLYLTTVNNDNIYTDLLRETFDPFNYRTAHLYYFNKASMEFLLHKVGFTNFKISYYHDYDLSNLLMWLKEKRPTGINAYPYIDENVNLAFKKNLEANGKAQTLWVEATKKSKE